MQHRILHDEKLHVKIFIGYPSCANTVLCTKNIRVKSSLKSLSLGSLPSSWGFHQNLILFKALTSSKLFTLITANFLSPYISLPEDHSPLTILFLHHIAPPLSQKAIFFRSSASIWPQWDGRDPSTPIHKLSPFWPISQEGRLGKPMKSILFMSYIYVMRNLVAEFFVK